MVKWLSQVKLSHSFFRLNFHVDSSTFVVLPWYARSRCTPRFRHCACHMWLYHVIPQQHFNGLQCLKLRPLVISFHRLFLSLVFAGADWRVDAKETQMTFYSPKCLFWNLDWENIWRLPILNRCDSFWRLCVSPWVGRRDFGNSGLSNKHPHLSSGTGCDLGKGICWCHLEFNASMETDAKGQSRNMK